MSLTSGLSEDKVRDLREKCKELGFKLTHQRLEIFNTLSSMHDHPSAEAIYQAVRKKVPTIAFDTVYRTLALFERYGLITKVQFLEGKARYDSQTEPHCHLICTRCREIEDFYWPEFDQFQIPIETAQWGMVRNKYLELRGICQDCLARGDKS